MAAGQELWIQGTPPIRDDRTSRREAVPARMSSRPNPVWTKNRLFCNGLSQRQREAEHCAAQAIFRPDGAAVAFDDGARDRQAQPRPLWLCGDERIENVCQVVFPNACSGI